MYVPLSTISASLYCRILFYNGYNVSRSNAMFLSHRLREFLRMRNSVQHRRLSWQLKTRSVLQEKWIASSDSWILLLIIKYRLQVAKFIGL